jgi:hypothetical protein
MAAEILSCRTDHHANSSGGYYDRPFTPKPCCRCSRHRNCIGFRSHARRTGGRACRREAKCWLVSVQGVPEPIRPQMGNVKRVMGIVGGKVTKYQAGKELVPGITAIATPGHTPGHTSHVVASGSSKVLVQGDVTAGAATLFVRNPNWHLIGDTDKPQAAETRKKLYDMAASEKIVVQGFHFPFPGVAYVEKSGSGYRLVAVPWSSSI